MKRIYFIRHAKSSWKSSATRDIDRPLNKRGKRDAPFMANLLKRSGVEIDGIIKSPAQRITETVRPFIKEFEFKDDFILTEPSIYEGSLYDILDAFQSLPGDWNSVMLFGHNPAMTFTARYFGADQIINVPTCGIVEVESEAKDWSEVLKDNSRVVSFLYPKMYFSG